MLEKEYLLDVTPETDRMVKSFTKRFARMVYRGNGYLIFELDGWQPAITVRRSIGGTWCTA